MIRYSSLIDNQLLDLIKSGDEKAFAEIYERYWGLIFQHVFKMLGDKDESKDLVQELFTNLWIKADQIESDSNITGYLYVSARNKVINLARHNRIQKDYLTSLSIFASDSFNTTLEQLNAKDLSAALEKEIQYLPCKMREVFELSRNQYLSNKEIAQVLQISDKTVKKQINNALKILRLRLNIFTLVIGVSITFIKF